MKELYINIVLFLSFILSQIVGLLITNYSQKDKKEKYNYLNKFPFEMSSTQSNYNLIFHITLGLFCGMCALSSIVLLFQNGQYFLERVLCFILVINSFALLSLFMVDFRQYKVHLVNSIIFTILNLMAYFLLGYLSIRSSFNEYKMWIFIISLIIFLFLLVSLFLPSLKKWYILKQDDEGNYIRGKVFPLALFEWINIFLFLFIFIILTLKLFL